MRSLRSIDRARRAPVRAVVLVAVLATLLGLGTTAASAAAYPAPDGGTREVGGAILDRYLAQGGPGGFLGLPTTDELGTPNGLGRYNHFQGGSVYWSGQTGAHSIGGSIRDRWAAFGWESSFLGFPTTDELGTPNGLGRYNHFQGGSVYWSGRTGAHSTAGAIRDRWASLGWENSFLGFPTTDELGTPNGVGRYNHFQGGSVYWSGATGAHSTGGAIRDRWASLGWENSSLGFPTTDEYGITGGRAQDFQGGAIRWTPQGGTVVVAGRAVAPVAPRPAAALPLGARPPGSQLITVVAPSATSSTATLTAWQLGPAGWQAVLGPVPARVGPTGVGAASETSTKTPAGQFGLTEAFGRAGNPGTTLPYRVVDGNDWWVSDVTSAQYNQYARCAPGTCPFDESAGENLYRPGAVYDHAVVIDYNRSPAVRGAGSAFFLHVSNGAATAGCVAIDGAALQSVLRWLSPTATPVIAIGVG